MEYNEYILGNIFGITQVIIGHPFDTIKTNLQHKISIKPFIKKPQLLFNGIKYPMIMNGFGMSLIFGNYDYFYNLTQSRILSGIITGTISSFFITPFDLWKIQNQISTKNKINYQSNYNHQSSYKYLNILFKYYSGNSLTISREIIASPVYFYTYYYLNNKYQFGPFISGGFSGCISWLITYPIDTIKTRKQIYQNLTLLQLIKQGSLFKGITITLTRAFIVNSFCFTFYEYLKKLY